jgi:hypothetical protein
MATTRRLRWLIAGAVGVLTAGEAPAFYFKGWPGDGLVNPPSLIQSTAPTWGNPPSGRLYEDMNPVSRPPREWTGETEAPQQVPEPTALVLAAVGIAGMGVRRLAARRRHCGAERGDRAPVR